MKQSEEIEKITVACSSEVALEAVKKSLEFSPYRWSVGAEPDETGVMIATLGQYRELIRIGNQPLMPAEQFIRVRIRANKLDEKRTVVELKFEVAIEATRLNVSEAIKYSTQSIKDELLYAANRVDAYRESVPSR